MCKDCLRSVCPDRGSMALDTGAYFANYTGCAECSVFRLAVRDKTADEDDEGNETVSFTHVCGACEHVIALHEFSCIVDDGRHEYSMSCLLCGMAEDSRAIGVYDAGAASALT
ncbi:churchill [Thecamonas trahens ATCC 50062]|uniref:Protein Churchill n=1 Tax=Thecamonas trahens ATCC 50062 TaxID=461836 RepID=A0A0L0DNA6_THETB|nr:churchill [Thecamonas trahens ATCC 50062]KNC53794.1 churchill [Thecamonas trahens ATCC 50062]|eukprot:XP_013754355.1 churchill [Thecamonas trahens ATCC 50062]